MRAASSCAGGTAPIYRVQLLQQGTAEGAQAGEQKKLGDVLPTMKMRVQAKAKK